MGWGDDTHRMVWGQHPAPPATGPIPTPISSHPGFPRLFFWGGGGELVCVLLGFFLLWNEGGVTCPRGAAPLLFPRAGGTPPPAPPPSPVKSFLHLYII